MGNCIKIRNTPQQKIPTEEDEVDDGVPLIIFNITISKLKVIELKQSLLKSNQASISLKLKEKEITFDSVKMIDEVLRWSNSPNFIYKTSLSRMNKDRIEITVSSNNNTICYTEINVKSIIDGPVQQNIALILNGLIIGRVSFEIEMLEVTNLVISPIELKCELGEDNLGTFSVSIKFASDFTKESPHSTLSETPSWTFKSSSSDVPGLEMPVTMKTIRDAALQIRLYKHHKVESELSAECWISFNKLFSEDLEAIYRTESFLASNNKEEGTKLDFDKLIKSMNRIHYKKINEALWLCGRKIGNLNGEIRLSGIPTFVQLISGVNTEKGYAIQSSVYMSEPGDKGKENMPKKILKIIKITNELEESIQYNPQKAGLKYEKEMVKKKREMFEELFDLLLSTQKDSMVCFIYKNEKSLIKSQEILIHLGKHLVDFSKLVNYDIKPFYFRCLTYLIKRGELDIGYLSNNENTEKKITVLKNLIAVDYLKFIHRVLELALSRMAFKGVDQITEDFVYNSLPICWFRIQEFRESMIFVIKEKSYYPIEE